MKCFENELRPYFLSIVKNGSCRPHINQDLSMMLKIVDLKNVCFALDLFVIV